MADQVVLLNKGRIEQVATPRDLYARPASCFAARFIGTPPMNLLALDGGCIRGSTQRIDAPAGAVWLGLRPESIALDGSAGRDTGHVSAEVQDVEYLGADAVLRCRLGSQTSSVRTAGTLPLAAGTRVTLAWPAAAAHWFGADERRID